MYNPFSCTETFSWLCFWSQPVQCLVFGRQNLVLKLNLREAVLSEVMEELGFVDPWHLHTIWAGELLVLAWLQYAPKEEYSFPACEHFVWDSKKIEEKSSAAPVWAVWGLCASRQQVAAHSHPATLPHGGKALGKGRKFHSRQIIPWSGLTFMDFKWTLSINQRNLKGYKYNEAL